MQAEQLQAAAVDAADNAVATRLRLEAQTAAAIEAADAVVAALDVLDRAVRQLSARSLPAFSERLGRLYSLAMARLNGEEREAVRRRGRER